MKATTLLNRLERIKQEKTESEQVKKFNDLLRDIKMEVYALENNFTSTEKQGNKKATALLKKWEKNPLHFMGACDYQVIENETGQVFTNGYILFMLKRFYNLKTIEERRDELNENITYPNIARVVPRLSDGEKIEKSEDIITETLRLYKSKRLITENHATPVFFEGEKYDVWFKAEDISDVVKVLGTSELEVYIYGKIKPIQLHNPHTGDRAIIMPIRHDGNRE